MVSLAVVVMRSASVGGTLKTCTRWEAADTRILTTHAILSAPHPSSDFVRIGSGSTRPASAGLVQSQSLHIARAILSSSLLRSGPIAC